MKSTFIKVVDFDLTDDI